MSREIDLERLERAIIVVLGWERVKGGALAAPLIAAEYAASCVCPEDANDPYCPIHGGWVLRPASAGEPVAELAYIRVGTAAGMTGDRIVRIVKDADLALTFLEKDDIENARAVLRRGFQRAPVTTRLATTPVSDDTEGAG